MAKKRQTEERRGSEFSRTLKAIEEEARERGLRFTRDALAKSIGTSRSAVSAWFAGEQTPRARHLEALAEALAGGSERSKARYRIELFQSAGIPLDRSSAQDPMSRAREQTGVINIGVPKFDPAFEDFFETVVGAFADFCAFRYSLTRIAFKNLSAEVAKGEVDIAAGFLITPDRLRTLRFIEPHPPLFMGLGALMFGEARIAVEDAAKTGLRLDAIQPIMHEGQAGYEYAQRAFRISELKIITKQYDEEVFATELADRTAQWLRNRQQPIPTLISDELMLIKVQAELGRRILSGRLDDKDIAQAGLPVLVIGDGEPTWTRTDARRLATNPRFQLGLCVKRVPNDEWHGYLSEAWQAFLRGNPGFLKAEYEALHKSLEDRFGMVKTALNDLPNRWATKAHARITKGGFVDRWDELRKSWFHLNSGDPWLRVLDHKGR